MAEPSQRRSGGPHPQPSPATHFGQADKTLTCGRKDNGRLPVRQTAIRRLVTCKPCRRIAGITE